MEFSLIILSLPAQVFPFLAFSPRTEETARMSRGGLLHGPGALHAGGDGSRVTCRSLPRQSSGRQNGIHGPGAVFFAQFTQAPTLPHRGTLGGGRRAFFIFEE